MKTTPACPLPLPPPAPSASEPSPFVTLVPPRRGLPLLGPRAALRTQRQVTLACIGDLGQQVSPPRAWGRRVAPPPWPSAGRTIGSWALISRCRVSYIASFVPPPPSAQLPRLASSEQSQSPSASPLLPAGANNCLPLPALPVRWSFPWSVGYVCDLSSLSPSPPSQQHAIRHCLAPPPRSVRAPRTSQLHV